MTPKQQYEARKAERDKLKDMEYQVRERASMIMMLDVLDRFATAMERIADAMERPKPLVAPLMNDHNLTGGFRVANTYGSQETGG